MLDYGLQIHCFSTLVLIMLPIIVITMSETHRPVLHRGYQPGPESNQADQPGPESSRWEGSRLQL